VVLGLIQLSLAQEPPGGFGADVTVGYGAGTVIGTWPQPGAHGAAEIGVGLYPVPRTASGPRVGGLFWARVSAWPLQDKAEDCDEVSNCAAVPFRFLQFGLDLSFRSDPAVLWGGTFDFGFSRLDVEDWYGGPLAVPMFSVRPGIRHPIGPLYLEGALRAGVGAQRDQLGASTEWWVVSAEVGVGVHAR
jgi:hypothetical protein